MEVGNEITIDDMNSIYDIVNNPCSQCAGLVITIGETVGSIIK
jgi:hypothetical protein